MTIPTSEYYPMQKERCIDANRYDESTIMEYVPEIDRIFLLMPYDLNDAFPDQAPLPLVPFLIDLETASITPEAQTGAFPALSARSLVKNKFFYSEKLRALVMVPDSGSNVRIRRYA